MEWIDTAIVLHTRLHGETNAVLEVYAREHGRYLGLVRGGRSRRLRPLLQAGNLLGAEWRARLSEQLGFFVVDMREPFAARALDDGLALSGIATLAAHLALMPERDPHPGLFDMAVLLLQHLGEPLLWAQLLARMELLLLKELGLGLDLETCAATGTRDRLIYVSPRTGRAVSAEMGAPYADKLLPLPAFLRSGSTLAASPGEIVDALTLTGFFLERRIRGPRGLGLSESRAAIAAWLQRQMG